MTKRNELECEACEKHEYQVTLTTAGKGSRYKLYANCVRDLVNTALNPKQFKNLISNRKEHRMP